MRAASRWILCFALLSLTVAVRSARTSPMSMAAAPGRKALAANNQIFVQHNWAQPDKTLSRGGTQVQQPLLDDAWKHLQEDQNPSTKIQMLCNEQNPALCPNKK